MERGYVKLWRKTLDSGIIANGPAWQLFGYLLMNACHTEHKQIVRGAVFELKPGDVIFSRSIAAAKLGLGEQQIRTALKLLKNLEIVTSKSTNKITIISFVKWDIYNNNQPAANQQDNRQPNQQLTSNQPANPAASLQINKNVKNLNNININTAPPEGAAEHSQHSASRGEEKSASSSDKRKKGMPPDEPHYCTKSGRHLTGKNLAAFERFWEAFDYRKGKAEAADAWLNIAGLNDALVERICHAAREEAAARGQLEARGSTPKWAQGWISSRRWEDYETARPAARASPAADIFAMSLSDEEQARAEATRKRLEAERLAKKMGQTGT